MWERKMWIVFCVVLISVFSQMWMIAKVLSVWTGSLVLGWFITVVGWPVSFLFPVGFMVVFWRFEGG